MTISKQWLLSKTRDSMANNSPADFHFLFTGNSRNFKRTVSPKNGSKVCPCLQIDNRWNKTSKKPSIFSSFFGGRP